MAMRGKPKTNTKKIGDRDLSPATLMMGLGYDPTLSEGSLKPPIFLTSTFAFESAAAGKRFFEHITGKREGPADGLVYSRFNGPNQVILEDRLAVKLADAEKSIATTRSTAMGNVRSIAADAASAIVQRLSGVTPDAAAIDRAVDASLKG